MKIKIVLIILISMFIISCLKKGPPEIGDEAIPFTLESLRDGKITFDPKINRIKILYFWADWCPRCRDDFVQLEKFYQKWKKQPNGPVLLTVNVGQTIAHVEHFVKVLNVTFPVVLDKKGEIAKKYGVKGLPTYYIIDKDGKIRFIILGWAEERVLEDYLKRISN